MIHSVLSDTQVWKRRVTKKKKEEQKQKKEGVCFFLKWWAQLQCKADTEQSPKLREAEKMSFYWILPNELDCHAYIRDGELLT